MTVIKALAICGSLRKASFNQKLLNIAKTIAQNAGVTVTTADLKALNLPAYNYDTEAEGYPEPVKALSSMVSEADLLLIASPEYNYSIPGVLKNAIDWVSRVKPNPFSGKAAAIFGASTGVFGTVRGQNQLRQALTCVNVLMLSQPQILVGMADTAFETDGSLKNKAVEEKIRELIFKTCEYVRRIS
jgi:chromate reductase, NAD(P)H dehydrogenase (quinone)